MSESHDSSFLIMVTTKSGAEHALRYEHEDVDSMYEEFLSKVIHGNHISSIENGVPIYIKCESIESFEVFLEKEYERKNQRAGGITPPQPPPSTLKGKYRKGGVF